MVQSVQLRGHGIIIDFRIGRVREMKVGVDGFGIMGCELDTIVVH